MTSIFDLKTDMSQLSSANEGTSRMEYDQHPPTRDVVGNSFSNGAIHFRFQTSGQKWWIPNRSYLRMRLKLTKADGTTQLVNTDEIAPNMGLMSNLFQSGEFRINDKVVSRISDFMPQVDALETRITKSKSWLEGVGNSTNWWEEKQSIRQAEVSSDGSIVKDEVAVVPAGAITARGDPGFYIATSALANSQHAEYVAATGVVTFAGTGTGVGTLPDATAVWNVGDSFAFRGVATAGVNNVQMKVISVDSGTQITVEALLAANRAGGADPTEDFYKVAGTTVANATPSRRVGSFETVWTPPLSLFKVGHALPSGKYELVLVPQTSTSFQRRAIESALGVASKTPGLTGNFQISIVDFYLETAVVEGPRADDITYLLDLEQTRCQAEKINNTSFAQKNYDVSPSTYALTVAYQDLRAGENTQISASKFKSYESTAGSADPVTTQQELGLTRMFINYAGQNLPAPDADPSFVTGTDYTIERYAQSQIYNGAFFDSGGGESIEEYHDRGSYYYFSWPKDGTDRSTRVNVNQGFTNATDVTNMRCLLFDHSKQVARVRVQDGRVVDVQLEDA